MDTKKGGRFLTGVETEASAEGACPVKMLVDVEPGGGSNFGSCIKSAVLGMWR